MQFTIKHSVRLSCTPESAWDLLQDLAAIQDWGPDVASATAEPLEIGAERHVKLKQPVSGLDTIVEKIIDIDEREFTYEMVDGFGPFPSVLTTWRIGAHPSRVIIGSTVEMPWWLIPVAPAVKSRWRKAMHALAQAFATHCKP